MQQGLTFPPLLKLAEQRGTGMADMNMHQLLADIWGRPGCRRGPSSSSSAYPSPVMDALLSLENLVADDFVKVSCFHYQSLPNSQVFQGDCIQSDPDSFLLVGSEWQGVDEFSLTCRGH